jgi:hypothetical protein
MSSPSCADTREHYAPTLTPVRCRLANATALDPEAPFGAGSPAVGVVDLRRAFCVPDRHVADPSSALVNLESSSASAFTLVTPGVVLNPMERHSA